MDSPDSSGDEGARIHRRMEIIKRDRTTGSQHKYSRTDFVSGLEQMRSTSNEALVLNQKIARHKRAHREYQKAMHIHNNKERICEIDEMLSGQRPAIVKTINDLEVERRGLYPLRKWVDNDKEIYLFRSNNNGDSLLLIFDNTNVREWKKALKDKHLTTDRLISSMKNYHVRVNNDGKVILEKIESRQASIFDPNIKINEHHWAVTLCSRRSAALGINYGHAFLVIESVGKGKLAPGSALDDEPININLSGKYKSELAELNLDGNHNVVIRYANRKPDEIEWSQKSKTWLLRREEMQRLIDRVEWEIAEQKKGTLDLKYFLFGRPDYLKNWTAYTSQEFEDQESFENDFEENIHFKSADSMNSNFEGSKVNKKSLRDSCLTWALQKLLLLGIKLPPPSSNRCGISFPHDYTAPPGMEWKPFGYEEDDEVPLYSYHSNNTNNSRRNVDSFCPPNVQRDFDEFHSTSTSNSSASSSENQKKNDEKLDPFTTIAVIIIGCLFFRTFLDRKNDVLL